MPLNEETKEKIRNVFLRKFEDLPVAKDLPRLAKFMTVCDEDGKVLTYTEHEKIDNEKYLQNGALPVELKVFLHIRRVLLTLTTALEGNEQAIELDKSLLKHIGDENFFLPEILSKFMIENIGSESRLVKTLKCANQAAIAPPLIELKFSLGAENTTKDVSNSWRIIILITNEKNIRVINQKKEMCILNRFLLEWEFSVTLQDKMERLEDIYLKVLDVSFDSGCNSKRIADLRNILKKYSDTEFWNLTGDSKYFAMEDDQSKFSKFSFLPGEIVHKHFPNVNFIHRQHTNPVPIDGSLYLTNYWIFFQNERFGLKPFTYQIPLMSILKIIKRKEKNEVDITCKDIRVARFSFGKEGKLFKSFISSLQYAIPIYFNRIFAIPHSRALQLRQSDIETSSSALARNGWLIYYPAKEMKRLKLESERWRLSDINRHFQLCDSYPSELIVPKSTNDAELLMSAQYRKNGRFPVVTWRNRFNGAILCHSSIPNPSSDNNKMLNLPSREEDEKVLQTLIRTCIETMENDEEKNLNSPLSPNVLQKKKKKREFLSLRKMVQKERIEKYAVYLIDLVSRDTGKQQKENIEFMEEKHDDIQQIGRLTVEYDNLQDLKESYRKLQKLCTQIGTADSDQHWLSLIDNTRWLEGIHNVMFNSHKVYEIMSSGISVYLSCAEDSWDRGCQISSLAQLWMDPYYRSLRGFIVLVEKEWVSFGHKFADRSGFFSREDNAEIAPVFIQFLDCVFQTMLQFPNYFEFTNELLISLAENLYTGCYGTFISNSDAIRKANLIRLNTESFWTHAIDNYRYKNPFYIRYDAPILPSYNQRSLYLWSSYFLRWYEGSGPQIVSLPRVSLSSSGHDILSPTNYNSTLSEKQLLQRYISSLERASESIKRDLELQKAKFVSMKGGGGQISFQSPQHRLKSRVSASSTSSANVLSSVHHKTITKTSSSVSSAPSVASDITHNGKEGPRSRLSLMKHDEHNSHHVNENQPASWHHCSMLGKNSNDDNMFDIEGSNTSSPKNNITLPSTSLRASSQLEGITSTDDIISDVDNFEEEEEDF